MPYTSASGVPVPSATDAYSPTTQFKDWVDFASIYENNVIVADNTARNALVAPILREGLTAYVKSTKLGWLWDGSTWVINSGGSAGTVTPATGFTAATGTDLFTRSGVAYFTGNISKNSGSLTSGLTYGSLPVGFRPLAALSFPCAFNNATTGLATIDTSGVINAYFAGAAASALQCQVAFRVL